MKPMLENLTNEVFDAFVKSDRENILADVSERNLCSRLGVCMDRLLDRYGLTDYFVDCEYNRKQNGRIKTILDDNEVIVDITCDIVLHSRRGGLQRDNLIAIEMKKSGSLKKEKDRKWLRALTKCSSDDVWSYDGETDPKHVCNYQLGFYIELNIPKCTSLFEQYERGQKQKEWQRQF